MDKRPKNYGLIPEPKIRAKDWRFGAVSGSPKAVLSEDGNYLDYLPNFEIQAGVYFDTKACVSFSALNCLEIIFRAKGWGEKNFSDRALAKMSDTTKDGNYLSKVAETIRKEGIVPDADWDWNPNQRNPVYDWDDFYKAVPSEVEMKAKRWLNDFKMTWEWVSLDNLKEALKYGPLQVTVYAWNKKQDGIYPNPKNKYRNHAVTLVNYKEGEYWQIFDHYDTSIKRLAWDYEFGHALRFTVNKRIKDNMPTDLENDILVQDVEDSGAFALHLDGKLLVDDTDKLLATWLMRNDGDVAGKTAAIKAAEWDKFEKRDLKGNKI